MGDCVKQYFPGVPGLGPRETGTGSWATPGVIPETKFTQCVGSCNCFWDTWHMELDHPTRPTKHFCPQLDVKLLLKGDKDTGY